MFCSSNIVHRNSPAYQAWVVGLTEKRLKKNELKEMNVVELAKSILNLKNIRVIGVCTYGLSVINFEKAKLLYSDAFDVLLRVKNQFVKMELVVTPVKSVEEMDVEVPRMSQISICEPTKELFVALPHEITLHEQNELPTKSFNMEDDDLGECNLEMFDSQFFTEYHEDRRGEESFFSIGGSVCGDDPEKATVYQQSLDSLSDGDEDMYDLNNNSILSLPPVEPLKLKRRKRMKPRVLLIDHNPQISINEQRRFVDDYTDLIQPNDFGPVSKKIMSMRRTGCVEYMNDHLLTNHVHPKSPANLIYKSCLDGSTARLETLRVESFETQPILDPESIINWMTYAEGVEKDDPVFEEEDELMEPEVPVIDDREDELMLMETPEVIFNNEPRDPKNPIAVSAIEDLLLKESIVEFRLETWMSQYFTDRKEAARAFMTLLEMLKAKKLTVRQTTGIFVKRV